VSGEDATSSNAIRLTKVQPLSVLNKEKKSFLISKAPAYNFIPSENNSFVNRTLNFIERAENHFEKLVIPALFIFSKTPTKKSPSVW
jgi:hypothetical protein